MRCRPRHAPDAHDHRLEFEIRALRQEQAGLRADLQKLIDALVRMAERE